jgi:hypothetical protein
MPAESSQSSAESAQLTDALTKSVALTRLAENPLLLTMLLVVKHGAGGRLPPDRVSLYGRAVEVLLDTWNIKGHDPLSLKEAVPQLACVAFELMRQGKQTATTKELLGILDEAREKIPQIRRYARDTPADFLKRVELRSSLVVEAGYQAEDGSTVPFYQFRHLTFQEYLAAVAAVQGHYIGYDKADTLLTPLAPYLIAEEWKEVIPMSAVLARKQAQILIDELVAAGHRLHQQAEAQREFEGRSEWLSHSKPPAPVARLIQCLVEEAEAAPETLTCALQIAVFFACGCQPDDPWRTLAAGPYGQDLLHQAWLLYSKMDWDEATWLRNTFARLAAFRYPRSSWESGEVESEVSKMIESTDRETLCTGILTIPGTLWGTESGHRIWRDSWKEKIKPFLFADDPAILEAALFAWILLNRDGKLSVPVEILDRLTTIVLAEPPSRSRDIAAHALGHARVKERAAWKPDLQDSERVRVRGWLNENIDDRDRWIRYEDLLYAAVKLAFHDGAILSDDRLASKLERLLDRRLFHQPVVSDILNEMGPTGVKIYNRLSERTRRPANQ